MTEIIIENIITYAQIAGDINIEEISEKVPEFKYNPDEFLGLTLKLEKPNAAVLLLPDGKVICTGAKIIDDAETAIKKLMEKLKVIGIKVNPEYEIETQNIITSIDIKKELNLDLISKDLILENIDYEPEHFPGLIFTIDNIGASLILFSSGKLICTGVKSIEEASNAINILKEKLSSLGVL